MTPRLVLPVLLISIGVSVDPPQRSSTATFGTVTPGVVVDVIVRDRGGRPVTDVRLEEFELFEDGVRQPIGTLSMVAPGARPGHEPPQGGARPRAPRPPGQPDSGTKPTVMALVFDRLTPESREPARRAAEALLEAPLAPDDVAGVFQIDLSLKTLQPFTNDRELVRNAIEMVATSATSFQHLSREGTGTGAGLIVSAATRGGDMEPGQYGVTMQDVQQRLDEDFRPYENLHQGHASLDALQAIVSALAPVPGRKSIVYFTDSLPLAVDQRAGGGEGLRQQFDALIGRANTANVSIYPVDTVGLRVHSQGVANAEALRQAANSSLNADSGSNGAAMYAGIEILGGGTTSQVFQRLAKETGAFAIENTNDLATGVKRIDADRRFHYLLTYTPRNSEFRGEYRRIEVNVARRGVNVRARSGYRADLASVAGLDPVIVSAAAALDAQPRPTRIPIVARVLRLPQASAPGRLALVARVPASALRHASTSQMNRDATVGLAARILDERNQTVREATQSYWAGRPVARDLVFYRQPALPPGYYSVEIGVSIAGARQTGVTVLPIDIPEPAPSLLLAGDPIVVARAEQVSPGDVDASHPLLLGPDLLLHPNLGEPLAPNAAQPITLYLVVRPAARLPRVTASVAVVRDRQVLVTAPVKLTAPGGDGFIRQLVRLPLPALPSGRYTLRFDVSDGQNRTSRTTWFLVGAG